MSTKQSMSARDPVGAACDLLGRLSQLAMECPTDELWPGYTLTPESKQECARVVALLQEAGRLLEQCIAREEPRSEPFYQAFTLKERHEWAAKRGAADPLN